MVWMSEPWRAEEAFFVGVEDGDERNFGQVEAFAQEVDADEDVEFALAQIAQELDAFERLDLGVHVAAADADFGVVARRGLRPCAW